MFQYSDLSEIVPLTDVEMQGGEDDSIPSARQPEEEPARYRLDSSLIPPAAEYDPAIETPVPDPRFLPTVKKSVNQWSHAQAWQDPNQIPHH